MVRYLSRSPVAGKRVLVRVDFNVPIVRGRVEDDYDLVRVLPTVHSLLRARNTCLLISHHSNDRQSLRPLVSVLRKRLGRSVLFLSDPFTTAARRRISRAAAGSVFLVENVRFWRGERANSPTFARSLASLGEVFVNDAFGEFHRTCASMVLLPRFLPSYLGLLAEAEFQHLGRVIRHPRRPFVAIIGGAKVETKIGVMRSFLRRADGLIVGGVPAIFLLRSRGELPPGGPRLSRSLRVAISPLIHSSYRGELVLPADFRAPHPSGRRVAVYAIPHVPRGRQLLDIGPASEAIFRTFIRRARTIVWNGPMGLVERTAFARGTSAIARAIASSSAYRVVGGGDTVAFLRQQHLDRAFDYISTGGGAMLAFLAGEKLPALEALGREKRNKK